MIKILGLLNSVCHRFLNAALVRTRAEETEALRAVSMMMEAFRNRDQRDIDETTGTSRRGISAAIYVHSRDFCRRQHYAWFPARLALSDSHSLHCCGDAGPRIPSPGVQMEHLERQSSIVFVNTPSARPRRGMCVDACRAPPTTTRRELLNPGAEERCSPRQAPACSSCAEGGFC